MRAIDFVSRLLGLLFTYLATKSLFLGSSENLNLEPHATTDVTVLLVSLRNNPSVLFLVLKFGKFRGNHSSRRETSVTLQVHFYLNLSLYLSLIGRVPKEFRNNFLGTIPTYYFCSFSAGKIKYFVLKSPF